ncbi:MAG: sodium:proton antiporter NhaD [Parachlamydiaceae bacterium]|nr:sodium:proton antiporter NhaD [Parachlamydiaceae bacterium]
MNLFNLLMIITFVIGYLFIAIEHVSKINKTSIALLMAIVCWILQFASGTASHEKNIEWLGEHMANISQIVFFLLGALTIVEIINAHKGFSILSNAIEPKSKKKLLWTIGFISFFLSSILDNLTTTIIMVTLLRKLLDSNEDRLLLGGTVVVAANAGGAWTPIGDVTTTMLWIGGQLSTVNIIKVLFLPSLVCLVAFLAMIGIFLKGEFTSNPVSVKEEKEPMGNIVFWLGVICLISVPLFKIYTGLPPFMGMMFGLGLMWLFTDFVHTGIPTREHLRVPAIMTSIDVSGVLFFLGILLCIDALQTAGILYNLANWMDNTIGNSEFVAIAIGLASAVVDNVPLVAAVMGMYDLSTYPMDSSFWNLVAYCAGTGGSILVVGSAAGIAFMGLERVQFFWYLRRIGIAAFVGYFAGIGTFKLAQFF